MREMYTIRKSFKPIYGNLQAQAEEKKGTKKD